MKTRSLRAYLSRISILSQLRAFSDVPETNRRNTALSVKKMTSAILGCALLILPGLASGQETPPAWVPGDVFVAIGNSQYEVYHNMGTPSAPIYQRVET